MKKRNPFDEPEDLFHIGVKALIRNKEGKILLLQNNTEKDHSRNPAHWDLPGGRMQKGATIEETLIREIEEEIGVKSIEIGELLDTSISNFRIRFDQHSVGLLLLTYLCKIADDQKIKLGDEEHLRYEWFIPQEAAKLLSLKFSTSLTERVVNLK